jgi:hypothetical protein
MTDEILALMNDLGIGHLADRLRAFYGTSPHLNPAAPSSA